MIMLRLIARHSGSGTEGFQSGASRVRSRELGNPLGKLRHGAAQSREHLHGTRGRDEQCHQLERTPGHTEPPGAVPAFMHRG